ncbi:hypothetical protein N7501_002880 [Penicillium viridicatum]|nr:hypothetical protein N7501_002880 [Penicillium viridicatum]
MKALIPNRRIANRIFNHASGKSVGGQGKVKAVALNPTDFKHLDVISPPHSIIGCDYAGVVQ